MLRKLAPSFVVTTAALLSACQAVVHRARPAVSKPAGKTVAFEDVGDDARILNPTDASRNTIYLDVKGHCYVQGDRSPGVAGDYGERMPRVVDCPPEMDDPAWDTCNGGEVRLERSDRSDRCYCVDPGGGGNPPPPARAAENACPATLKAP